eukprot:9498707-Pyramimonas_sp.AAC.1
MSRVKEVLKKAFKHLLDRGQADPMAGTVMRTPGSLTPIHCVDSSQTDPSGVGEAKSHAWPPLHHVWTGHESHVAQDAQDGARWRKMARHGQAAQYRSSFNAELPGWVARVGATGWSGRRHTLIGNCRNITLKIISSHHNVHKLAVWNLQLTALPASFSTPTGWNLL